MIFLYLFLAVIVLEWVGLIGMAILNRAMQIRFNLFESLAFSWMTGMGIVSLQMFFYSLLGIPFSIISLISPWVLLSGFFLYIPSLKNSIFSLLRFNFLEDISQTWHFYIFLLVASSQILFTLLYGLSVPISGWDAWAMWFLKGKIFYLEHGIPVTFLKSTLPMHPDYPLLVPLSVTWVYTFLGQANDSLAKILYSFQYFSLIVIFYFFVKEFSSKKNADFFTTLFALIPLLIIHSSGLLRTILLGGLYSSDFVGYADLPLAVYFLAAGGFLALGVLRKNAGCWVVAAFFAGMAAWTKNEGLNFSLIILALIAFYGVRTRLSSWKIWLFIFTGLGFFIVPWLLYKKYLQLGNEYIANLSFAIFKKQLGNLKAIASEISRNFFTTELYNLTWWVYLFSQLQHFRRLFHPPVIILNIICWTQLACYILIYLITPHEIMWHLLSSLERLLLHLIPLIFLTTAISFSKTAVTSYPAPRTPLV